MASSITCEKAAPKMITLGPRIITEPTVKLPVMNPYNNSRCVRIPTLARTQNPLVESSLLDKVFPLATNTPPPSVKTLVVNPELVPLPGVSKEYKELKRRVARQMKA